MLAASRELGYVREMDMGIDGTREQVTAFSVDDTVGLLRRRTDPTAFDEEGPRLGEVGAFQDVYIVDTGGTFCHLSCLESKEGRTPAVQAERLYINLGQ